MKSDTDKRSESEPVGSDDIAGRLADTFHVSQHKLANVQIARAIAALVVCIGHGSQEAHLRAPETFPDFTKYFPTEIGVDLFFIISGFIMMVSFGDKFGRIGAPIQFSIRRIVRIYPSYWFFTSLIIGVAWAMPALLNTSRLSIEHAILSYLLIPHRDPGTGGGIHPILGLGWTLMYEMLFYSIFALALFMNRLKGLVFSMIALAGLFLMGKFVIPNTIFGEFTGRSIIFEFAFGMSVGFMYKSGCLSIRSMILVAAGAALTTLSVILFDWTEERIFTLGAPALVVFLLIQFLPSTTSGVGALARTLCVCVGEASYAIYLMHPFVIKVGFIGAAVLSPKLFSSASALGIVLAFIVLVTILFAGSYFLLLERPVTSFLMRRFAR